MRLDDLVKPEVLTQPVYEPGRPIEDVAKELGLDPKTIIKLASNENPWGPSPLGLAAARESLAGVAIYPDGGTVRLRERLAELRGVLPNQVVVGNGSNELIELLGHLFLRPGDEVVMGVPAFIVYKLVTLLFGAKPVEVPLRDHCHDLVAIRAAITPRTRMVFLPSPNNPTGTANTEAEIYEFVRSLPERVIFVLDEAYAEYLENAPDLRPLIDEGRWVIGLRTFSKIYGLAGLRVGYGYGPAALAARLHQVRQPFNVNAVGQAAALAATYDAAFVQQCREENARGLAWLQHEFEQRNWRYVASVANFILLRVGDGADCFTGLQGQGLVVRPMGPYGMRDWVRVTVGNPSQNERMLLLLDQWGHVPTIG